jgi:hypothetical protein
MVELNATTRNAVTDDHQHVGEGTTVRDQGVRVGSASANTVIQLAPTSDIVVFQRS